MHEILLFLNLTSSFFRMESSRIPRNYNEQDSEPYVISSSFLDRQESDAVAPRQFVKGVFPFIQTSTLVITSTTTSTSFNLVALTVKKPFTLAPGAALTCLPPGFAVC